MAHASRVRAMVYILVAVTLGITPFGAVPAASAADGSYIVMYSQGTCLDCEASLLMPLGVDVKHVLPLINSLAIKIPPSLVNYVLGLLNPLNTTLLNVINNNVVEVVDDLVTRVGAVCPIVTPLPPLDCLPEQDCYPWGMQASETDYAHEQFPPVRGAGVRVAIIDTGISWHKEFDNRLEFGYNALPMGHPEGPPLSPVDYRGHGTAMAGTVGANLDNLLGIVGVAPGVTIVPVKAFDYKGEGYISDVINALQWARDSDVSAVSMSFGFSGDNTAFKDAIKSLYDSGMIMVASAGNRCSGPTSDDGGGDDCLGGPLATCENPLTTVTYPAAYDKWVLSVGASKWVLPVGASDFHSEVTDYSLPGPVDVVAPGGEPALGVPDLVQNGQIVSTNTGLIYARGHGTSPAAAHVAGAIALLLQRASDLDTTPPTFEAVRSILRTTATPLIDPATGKSYPNKIQGAGLINVEKIIDKVGR